MKRKLRFVFPRRSLKPLMPNQELIAICSGCNRCDGCRRRLGLAPLFQPFAPPVDFLPHPLGGATCTRCGAHWPMVWMAIVPPCSCHGPWYTVTSTATIQTL